MKTKFLIAGVFLFVLLVTALNPLIDRVEADSNAGFQQYRRGLVESRLTVINLEGDAYPNLLRAEDEEGNDLTKFRSADALILRVPTNGRLILTTAGTYESVLSLGRDLTYAEIPVTVRAGDFLDVRGHHLSRNEAKDFYKRALRDDWLRSGLKGFLLWLVNPNPEPETDFE